MGWAFCGPNRHGQDTGYGVSATCDEPGCDARIDRGLGYLCGGNYYLHDTEETCAKYYCSEHLVYAEVTDEDGEKRYLQVCSRCAEEITKREEADEDHQTELQDRGDST